MASASAVEWMATVAMPISLQARLMRSAISPRFAIRSFSNIERLSGEHEQRLSELDRLGVAHEDFRNRTSPRRENGIHCLHRFDDQQRIALAHRVANFHEWRFPRFRRGVHGADHR